MLNSINDVERDNTEQSNMVIDNSDESEKSSAEDDQSEEDDSSMSEGECERRKANCLENLAQLEKQFEILKEQLYRERISQVENQLNEVRGEKSQEYLAPLQRLNDNMNSRKEVAEILKNYRMENIKHKFESEEQAALQHFESEKQLTKDSLFDELMEKIRRLEEDRHNVDLSWDDWGDRNMRPNKVRGPGRKKAVTVTGPFIVYMLREEEIIEDWNSIRKALNQQREYQNIPMVK
uniref:CSON015332 protein n=1 Tax=Culicoides sonorensis TaxID=179676 RepID=A0A336K949_CULSO